jgi:hypothetical protein
VGLPSTELNWNSKYPIATQKIGNVAAATGGPDLQLAGMTLNAATS